MLAVQYLVAFLAVCVTHTCVVSGEGYGFQKDMGSTTNQTQDHLVLTPILSEMLHPEKTPSAEAIEVFVPTPTETPCPPLPTPPFETESDTEALTKKAAFHDGEGDPESVVTLVMETHPPFETATYTSTPASTELYAEVALVSKTKALQNEETTKTYSAPGPTVPCPTLVMAAETEAFETEKITETYSTPTIPCSTFTLMPETEAN